MTFLTSLYELFGMWRVRIAALLLLLALGAGAYFLLGTKTANEELADAPLAVKVAPIGTLGSGSSRTFVGTVTAVSQAKLQTETSGRVVAVPVKLGDQVRAGRILVQLENASERAALTQAQGAYEAAKANALQGDSSVRNAETTLLSSKNSVLSTLRSAYTTANGVLISDVDQFFASPQTAIPGLRVNGPAPTLNAERVAFQSIMSDWQKDVTGAKVDDNLETLLSDSISNTNRLIALLDTFISITITRKGDLAGQPLDSYTQGLLTARGELDASVNALTQAGNNLTAARESLSRAQIAGTDATVSLANAQLTQALGSLQAAQAAYNKTIVRSPITGTINSLQVKVGDSLMSGAAVAEVVNDSAYELSIFVTESDRAALTVGDVVRIGGSASGTITSIAPALDARTQKIEVKIALESTDALSGSTAIVSLDNGSQTDSDTLTVPITAVAFSVGTGAVFTVVDGVITPLPVEIGEVRGTAVTITGDVDSNTVIVTDARGLIVGQRVTVAQ